MPITLCTSRLYFLLTCPPTVYPCSTTLDWLKLRLTEEGFGYRTISGSMPLSQRTEAIEAFQKDPPTTVFLLSMRSGAGVLAHAKSTFVRQTYNF